MKDKILDLEIKVAYLEDYLNQLNEIIIKQDKKIDKLIVNNNQLIDKISLLEENIKEPLDNTPPPHY